MTNHTLREAIANVLKYHSIHKAEDCSHCIGSDVNCWTMLLDALCDAVERTRPVPSRETLARTDLRNIIWSSPESNLLEIHFAHTAAAEAFVDRIYAWAVGAPREQKRWCTHWKYREEFTSPWYRTAGEHEGMAPFAEQGFCHICAAPRPEEAPDGPAGLA